MSFFGRPVALTCMLFAAINCPACSTREQAKSEPSLVISDSALTAFVLADSQPLFQIRSAFFRGDTIVVAEGSTGRVHLFSSTGRLLRTVGGKGSGPGEYQNIEWMQQTREGFAVYDRETVKISKHRANGDFVSTGAKISIAPGADWTHPVGTLDDGSAVAYGSSRVVPPVGSVTADTVRMMHYASDSAAPTLLARFVYGEGYIEPRPNGGLLSMSRPFGRESGLVIAGRSVMMLDDDSTIRVVNVDSQHTSRIALPITPRVSITESARTTKRDAFVLAARGRADVIAAYDRIPLPKFYYRYGWHGPQKISVMRRTTEGRVWVTRAGGADADTAPSWLVISSEGKRMPNIRANKPMEVFDERNGVALTLSWDANDVESLQLRRIISK